MNSKEPCLGSAFSQVSPKVVGQWGLEPTKNVVTMVGSDGKIRHFVARYESPQSPLLWLAGHMRCLRSSESGTSGPPQATPRKIVMNAERHKA